MAISLSCPECSGNLKVADNLAGKKIKCPKCSTVFAVPAQEAEAIVAEIPPDEPEDIDEEDLPRPRRATRDIRHDPAGDAVSTIIPYKNGRALTAYYLGVFSLIPCAGLFLGPAALVLGILGWRYAKAHPTAKGGGHAIAGIVLGGLTTLGNWGLIVAMGVAVGLDVWTASSR